MDKLNMKAPDMTDVNIEKIGQLFPNCITERIGDNGEVEKAIDFDQLRQELSKDIVEGSEERYQFTWPDKRNAIRLSNTPTNMTLRPCREESVDFDNTENLYIEGDNLEVLKLLRENYLGKIKMIYIDPPYNTGNDFVYNDDFSQTSDEYKEQSSLFNDEGERMVKNLDSNGRFHTDWLNMMYPRLKVAKDLLSNDGAVFISIDENEIGNLRKICDELFNSANFCGCFIINSTPNARDYGHIGKMHEYCLFYAKDKNLLTTNLLLDTSREFKYKDKLGGYNIHPLYNSNEAFTNINRPNLFYPFYLYTDKPLENNFYEIGLEPHDDNCIEIFPPKSIKNNIQFVWRWGKEKASINLNKEIIGYKTNENEFRIVQKMRHDSKIIRSLLLDTKYSSRRGTAEVENLFNNKIFSFPKPLALLNDFINICTDNNSLVLDLFAGSSTTAHSIFECNSKDGNKRKFIMVQLPEKTEVNSDAYKAGYKNICEIGKERIRRAGSKIKEENKDKEGIENLDTGFRVLKLDSSNMKDVFYSPKETEQRLLFEDNIKEDRTPEDLLFQVMLECNLPLSAKIETEVISNKTIYNVNEGYLYACFDTNIDESVITEVAKRQPYYFIMRDSSMASDNVMDNFDQIFKAYSKETIRKVL